MSGRTYNLKTILKQRFVRLLRIILFLEFLSENSRSMFQAEAMAIYQAAQWILVNGVPFTRVLVFSDSQAAIISQSGFVNNFYDR